MTELIVFIMALGTTIAWARSTYKEQMVVIWLLGLLTLIATGLLILIAMEHQSQKDINEKLTAQIQELNARVQVLETSKAEMDVSATCVAWYFNTNLEEAKRRVCKK